MLLAMKVMSLGSAFRRSCSCDRHALHSASSRLESVKSDVPSLDKDVYYVHTYQAPMNDDVVAYTDYGTQIPGIVQRGPYIGIQFHPEKKWELWLGHLSTSIKGGWQHD